jgi:hypothetical protein
MNRRNAVMIALGALVAGAALLVHAENESGNSPHETRGGAAMAAADNKAPPTEPSYDFNGLPEPVRRMLEHIAEAAQSGEIENLRPVLESNELKPMVAADYIEDPISFWRKESADGSGRDVLAAMLNVMSSGFVRVGEGKDEIYVWPYFAETDLTKLTPAQEVELYRVVSPSLAIPMKKEGKYSYYRLGISPSGVWHYFIR